MSKHIALRVTIAGRHPGAQARFVDQPLADAGARFIALMTLAAIGFIGLYMVKSALGIDLFGGPSFMHELFYAPFR